MAPITRARAKQARDASRQARDASRRARDASSSGKPSPPNGLIPYSPPVTRARRARYAASSDRLPVDVLSDVLQRFPAKDLCRLRTVCRSWRSIISDKVFITEHADSHKEPLFLAKLQDDKKHLYVVDLSGNVVKQIPGADGGLQVLRTRLDLACLATEWNNKCRVLDPATGGIRQVHSLVPNRGNAFGTRDYVSAFFTFGMVASTREYKLLRCLTTFNNVFGVNQLSGVHVLTICGGTSTDHAQWRPRPGPSLPNIDVRSGVVADGVVYFLTSKEYILITRFDDMASFHAVPTDYILSFDLAREEWRKNLYGPSVTGSLTSGSMVRSELTLADLDGSLVVAHHPHGIMDLWFLLDFESTHWVKQYNIQTESVTTSLFWYQLIPLLVLDDGRLVIHLKPYGQLLICDPVTNTFTKVNTRDHVDSVAMYTGSLLSLQEGHKV